MAAWAAYSSGRYVAGDTPGAERRGWRSQCVRSGLWRRVPAPVPRRSTASGRGGSPRCPGLVGQFLPAGRGQIQIAAGPVCRAAVVSHRPEYAYKPITAQMHLLPLRRNRKVADRHVAAVVRIDLTVGLEPGQPGKPPTCASTSDFPVRCTNCHRARRRAAGRGRVQPGPYPESVRSWFGRPPACHRLESHREYGPYRRSRPRRTG